MSATHESTSTTVAEQAAEWFARMRSDARTPAVQAEFDRWLTADAAHEREYREMERLWGELTPLGRSEPLRALRQRSLQDSRDAAATVPRRRRLRTARAAALACGVMALGALLAVGQFPLQQASYQTAPGDRHTVHLADGSRITLNTDTLVRVDFGWRTRRVTLERGQAHFKVATAVLRPFEVDAGSSVVRALGTAFDVYRSAGGVQVTLVEGKVEVLPRVDDASSAAPAADGEPKSTILLPGQQVRVTPIGISSVRPVSVERTTSWLNGRLIFDNERLQDAAAEVNRYSSVKLVVLDRSLAAMRISGVFRAGRAETFIDALRASYPIEVVAAADSTIIIRPAMQDAVAVSP